MSYAVRVKLQVARGNKIEGKDLDLIYLAMHPGYSLAMEMKNMLTAYANGRQYTPQLPVYSDIKIPLREKALYIRFTDPTAIDCLRACDCKTNLLKNMFRAKMGEYPIFVHNYHLELENGEPVICVSPSITEQTAVVKNEMRKAENTKGVKKNESRKRNDIHKNEDNASSMKKEPEKTSDAEVDIEDFFSNF